MNIILEAVTIAPMTTKSHDYPSRVTVDFKNNRGWIVLDRIRTVDRKRLVKRLGEIDRKTVRRVKSVIKEMLVDQLSITLQLTKRV
jgi:mRNA interferase MazF